MTHEDARLAQSGFGKESRLAHAFNSGFSCDKGEIPVCGLKINFVCDVGFGSCIGL